MRRPRDLRPAAAHAIPTDPARHDNPEVGRIAQIAWDGLNGAVHHHHSYELQPTTADVRSLLRLVVTVVDSPSL
jgi:hypothetical protein